MQDELFRLLCCYLMVVVSLIVGFQALFMVMSKKISPKSRDLLLAGMVLTFIVSTPLGLVYYAHSVKRVVVFGASVSTLVIVGVLGVIGIILLAYGSAVARQKTNGDVR